MSIDVIHNIHCMYMCDCGIHIHCTCMYTLDTLDSGDVVVNQLILKWTVEVGSVILDIAQHGLDRVHIHIPVHVAYQVP